MAKLDRLGWAVGTCGTAHGVRIGVRVSDPALLDAVRPHLPPGWRATRRDRVDRLFSIVGGKTGGRLRRMNLAYTGVRRLVRTADREEMLQALAAELRFTVAASSPRRTFVHAGVVEWQGQALLLPGRSFAGKSTLVAALLRAGARYYSDEYAVLDVRGRVHPFAKPLSLRRPGGVDETPPEALGSRAGTVPLAVGLIAFSRYREGARWRARRMSPGRATLELFRHTGPARRRPRESLARLAALTSATPCLTAVRGEAAEAAEKLLRLFERESAA